MLKSTLLGALLCLGINGHTANLENDNDNDLVKTGATQIESEMLAKRRSLASHLGMTPDEAVFSNSRDMRSRYLNEMRLDENRELAPLVPRETPH